MTFAKLRQSWEASAEVRVRKAKERRLALMASLEEDPEPGTKLIPLSQGKFAKIDEEDFERVNQFIWYTSAYGYAVRMVKVNGKKTFVWMHRFLMNCPEGKEVDHKNWNTLDNRKQNLRVCERHENCRHSRGWKRRQNGLHCKGVVKVPGRKQFWARCYRFGKTNSLGYFHTEIDAAKAYNDWVLKTSGEFAFLNPVV